MEDALIALVYSVGPLLGLAVGYIAGRRRGPAPPKPIAAICGCEHDLSMHDPDTNRCHDTVRGDPVKYDNWKEPTAWAQVQCPCRQYIGPRPIDQVFAPRILPPAGS